MSPSLGGQAASQAGVATLVNVWPALLLRSWEIVERYNHGFKAESTILGLA